MLRCEDNSVSMSYQQKRYSGLRTAVSAYYCTLLARKVIWHRVDQHQMLFLLIRNSEVAVLLESNRLRCEENSVRMSYAQKH